MNRILLFIFALLSISFETRLVAKEVTDVLTASKLGVLSTSYTDFTQKVEPSNVVYEGNIKKYSKTSDAIQMRSDDCSGIITTTPGGKVKKIVVTWNSNTLSGRTIDIYGKNSVYSAASDLYGSSTKQGTKLGSIIYGTSTELVVSGNYTYIGLRSNSDALYADQIEIVWELEVDDNQTAVASPVFSHAAGVFYESFDLSLSCETEGAEIRYTTDGTEPTVSSPLYVSAINIPAATTIVKAIAVKGEVQSPAAVATYTYAPIITILEAKKQYDKTGSDVLVYVNLAGTVVTQNSGDYLFLEDTDGVAINVYKSNAEYPVGTKFTFGILSGKSSCDGGLHQITEAIFTQVATEEVEIVPTEVSIGSILSDYATYECRYVVLAGTPMLQETTITADSEAELATYDKFSLDYAGYFDEAAPCSIKGIVAKYGEIIQLYPTDIATTTLAALPTLSITEGSEVELSSTLTIVPAENTIVQYRWNDEDWVKITSPSTLKFSTIGKVTLSLLVSKKFYASNEVTYTYTVKEPESACKIYYHVNGEVSEKVVEIGTTLQSGDLPSVNAPSATIFAGWSTDADCSSAAGLASFPMTIESKEIHLYAVYQYDDSKFVKVTSTKELRDGDVVIITSAVEQVALSTTQNQNNRSEISLDGCGNDEIAVNAVSDKVQRLVLTQTNSYYAFNTGKGYLYHPSSEVNHLKTQNSLEANCKWIITFSDGVAIIRNIEKINKNEYYLQHNVKNNIFSCYQNSQKNVYIYKLVKSDIYSTTYTIVNFPDDLGYVTFCFDKNIILSPAVKAYVASEAMSGYVNLSEVPSVVPAGEGCLLSAPKGDYTLLVGGEAETLATNYLKGYCGEADYENVVLEDGYSYYILTVQNEALVFGRKTSDFRVKKNRAYLRIPEVIASSVLSINLGATSINRIASDASLDHGFIYDIKGRRIERIVRSGLYIVGGKKIYVK